MAISVACECGKKYRVKDSLAGKKIRCADCSELIRIPKPKAAPVDDEDEFAELLEESREQEESQPALPPPIKRRAKATKRKAESDNSDRGRALEKGWFGSTNGGVLGGVLMVVIAVVWFVAGLAGGRIFFYPPVLLIIGIVAVIKGLLSRD
jgi:hypothetical protein